MRRNDRTVELEREVCKEGRMMRGEESEVGGELEVGMVMRGCTWER